MDACNSSARFNAVLLFGGGKIKICDTLRAVTLLLEGVRSVGAVKWCQFTAGNGCEGPQPSKPPPIIVATNGWAIAG